MKTQQPPALGPVDATNRGFPRVLFNDTYDTPCSLQVSSCGECEAIWLGTTDAQPKVLAQQARSVGVETSETSGWVPYPIPEAVLLSTRAHLNREQVEALVVHLQNWLDTGTF